MSARPTPLATRGCREKSEFQVRLEIRNVKCGVTLDPKVFNIEGGAAGVTGRTVHVQDEVNPAANTCGEIGHGLSIDGKGVVPKIETKIQRQSLKRIQSDVECDRQCDRLHLGIPIDLHALGKDPAVCKGRDEIAYGIDFLRIGSRKNLVGETRCEIEDGTQAQPHERNFLIQRLSILILFQPFGDVGETFQNFADGKFGQLRESLKVFSSER